MSDFLQLTLNGVAVGCIYGLVALGFVLIYKATELVNFAQGDLLMLGAFVCYMAIVWWGFDYWLAFAFAIVVIAIFGGRPAMISGAAGSVAFGPLVDE